MSYHNIPLQSRTNAQGEAAPSGFHYMPDGTLMSDIEHGNLYGEKKITAFDIDLSNIPAAGESRALVVSGDNGAVFTLFIQNEDSYYYNFSTKLFQVAKATLENIVIENNSYSTSVSFPSITDNDQYDVFLFAAPGTRHDDYKEVRFEDGSMDINSTTGSNSLLLQKVIYQYTDITLTITTLSPNSTIETGSQVNHTIATTNGRFVNKQPFSIACAVSTAAKCYQVIKQPTEADVLAFVSPVIGAAPSFIQSEDVFPFAGARAAFTGDDVNGAVTSGAIIRIDGTVSGNVIVGDKLQTGKLSGTTAQESDGVKVILTAAVAGIMAVGDQITGNAFLDAEFITVAALNPDGNNDQEFSMSQEVQIAGDVELTFVGEVNRKVVVVKNLDPTSGTNSANKFTISEAIQFRDNVPLSFFTRLNYRWPITNFAHILQKGMTVLSATNVTSGSVLGDYTVSTTTGVGTEAEATIISDFIPAISTLGNTPTIVKGEITVQPGEIVFDRQQQLALAGDTIRIGGYGESEILRIHGWDVRFTDLEITLTVPTTTTTEATSAHATIAVASKQGVINNVSRVGGIGIDPSIQNPLITSGGGATGAGDWVMNAVQTLESGITLTVENTSRVATITGNIEIVKAGTASQSLYFDIERLLSTSA